MIYNDYFCYVIKIQHNYPAISEFLIALNGSQMYTHSESYSWGSTSDNEICSLASIASTSPGIQTTT